MGDLFLQLSVNSRQLIVTFHTKIAQRPLPNRAIENEKMFIIRTFPMEINRSTCILNPEKESEEKIHLKMLNIYRNFNKISHSKRLTHTQTRSPLFMYFRSVYFNTSRPIHA